MTGNALIDRVLMGLCLFVAVGTLGFFVYSTMIFKKPLPDDKQELAKMKAESAKDLIPPIFKLGKQTVNLPSQGQRLRFLEIEVQLMPFKESSIKKLESKVTFLNDIMIDTTSKMTPEELNTVAGKIILEDRLKKGINEFYHELIVKRVLFTSFVIQ